MLQSTTIRTGLICLVLLVATYLVIFSLWQRQWNWITYYVGNATAYQSSGNQSSYQSNGSNNLLETWILNGPTKRPLLVDITEKNLMGLSSKKYVHHIGSWSSSDRGRINNILHNILWWDFPGWLPPDRLNRHAQTCFYNNCKHIGDRNLMNSSSAVLFYIGRKLPKLPPKKSPNQVWIYYRAESPATLGFSSKTRLLPSWKNVFNWSMTFHFDSDIVLPGGYLKTREVNPQRNYSGIFRQKTKWAAWIVSHCKTPSNREIFVDKLKRRGLPVDIYGGCGIRRIKDPEQMISNDYKFYLAFENSMCEDYVTEKFYKYFNYDTVIVVRGGADYKKLLPHNTFIDTADFKSFKEIVEYLKYVGNNETLYTDFLRRKDKYWGIWNHQDKNLPYCAMCAKLNNIDTNRKTYETIPSQYDTCYKPNDVKLYDRE